jgi:hypothetical protein
MAFAMTDATNALRFKVLEFDRKGPRQSGQLHRRLANLTGLANLIFVANQS